MTRLLVVGCGNIAVAAHLPALARIREEEGPALEVVVADIDRARAEAAGARFGMEPVADWRAAAADVDCVSVCLPPGLNARVAAEAAAMGRHVVCEKPPGRTVEQARDLARAAATHPGLVTMVAFNRRFNPVYAEATALARPLGPPTSFYGRVSGSLLGRPPSDGVDDWLTSAGSHALDLAVATMGFPAAVSVDRRRVGAGPDNAWTVLLHCPQGSAALLFHFAAGRRTEHYEWIGPTYDVRLDLPKDGDIAVGGDVRSLSRTGDFHDVSGFTAEYRAFLAAVAGGPRPACDFAYGLRFMTLVDTLLRAPAGTLAPVPDEPGPADGREAVGTPAPAPPVAGPRPSRPVVVLHQPVAAHPRFFSGARLSALHERCDVRVLGGGDPASELRPAHVIVTGRSGKALSDHLGDAPDLRLVVVVGASVASVEPAKLLDRGVVVCNTADAVAQSVAEHCLMVTLAGLRRLTANDRGMHAGEWPRPGARRPGAAARLHPRRVAARLPLPPAVRTRLVALDRGLRGRRPRAGPARAAPAAAADLRGQVVGLVGWSHTARRFAELLAPFGCDVLVASEAADPAEVAAAGARPASLGEIVGGAKVISLHKGLTDASRGFVDAGFLDRLRPGTVLVNSARGELVDEDALLRRLAAGDIVAALDVFAEEPLPAKHPLRRLPNVILTPHNASTTEQEERRMGDQAIATVLDWLDGRPIAAIGPERLARMT